MFVFLVGGCVGVGGGIHESIIENPIESPIWGSGATDDVRHRDVHMDLFSETFSRKPNLGNQISETNSRKPSLGNPVSETKSRKPGFGNQVSETKSRKAIWLSPRRGPGRRPLPPSRPRLPGDFARFHNFHNFHT